MRSKRISCLNYITLAFALTLGGCGSESSETEMEQSPPDNPGSDVSCIAKSAAFPISSAIEPSTTTSAFYNTVSAFEYADMERTHVHPADFYVDEQDITVTSTVFEGAHELPYNIVTRNRNEAFLYGAELFPYVTKFDVETEEVLWKTEIPVVEGAFGWIGLVAAHGNGDIYAVHAGIMLRIDSETGDILQSKRLPPPEGVAQDNVVYNGFTIAPNGLIIAKSFSRPERCELSGSAVLLECVTEETPQPPSLVSTLDPESLEVLSSVLLPESITGRPAVSQYDGQDFIYLNGINDVYRIIINGNELAIDDTWQYSGFLAEGQTNPSSVVVMGDWVVFQTNGTPTQTPMTMHAVSQADSDMAVSRDPFISNGGPSFISSSLSADPESMRIYSQDAGRGQIGSFELVMSETGPEFVEHWVVDQRTLAHVTLIGPAEERILVATDAPDAVTGLLTGSTAYEEQMVWRYAENGEEITRSEILAPMFNGGPVTPGFDGTLFYLGLDGAIRQLRTYDADSICEE